MKDSIAFYKILQKDGIDITNKISFPDHKEYNLKEEKIITIPNTPALKIYNNNNVNPVILKKYETSFVLFYAGGIDMLRGLDLVIEALPKIIKKHDNTMYIILGVTHPGLLRTHGEEYRHSLRLKVKNLGLEKHVQFHNKFVDLETLTEYLIATDIYITPYLSKEQITSGTLAYAVGAGNAVSLIYQATVLASGTYNN